MDTRIEDHETRQYILYAKTHRILQLTTDILPAGVATGPLDRGSASVSISSLPSTRRPIGWPVNVWLTVNLMLASRTARKAVVTVPGCQYAGPTMPPFLSR